MTLWHFFQIQLYIGVLYVCYRLLAHRNTNFRFHRFLLLSIPVFASLLPFLSIQSVGNRLPAITLETVSLLSSTEVLTTPSDGFAISDLLRAAYISGVVIGAFLLLREFFRIRQLLHGEPIARVGRITVIRSNHPDSFSFFNRIVLSEQQLDHADLIIRHELAHCRQRHTIDLLIMGVFKALFWFNPFVYLLEKSIRANHEFLADRDVMQHQDTTLEAYATAIMSVHFNSSFPHFGSGFNAPSLLRKRIQLMKHKNNSIMKHFILLPLAAGMLFATSSMNCSSEPVNTTPASITVQQPEDQLVQPTFPGGTEAMISYISDNIKYPESLKKEKVPSGKTFVGFVVKADGSVSKVATKRSSGYPDFDKEAERLVKGMPKWNPGTKNGKPVDTEMILPIAFAM